MLSDIKFSHQLEQSLHFIVENLEDKSSNNIMINFNIFFKLLINCKDVKNVYLNFIDNIFVINYTYNKQNFCINFFYKTT
jgi:hypothetical protein